jgi:5-methyltetrahydropteroyltriglutamate--homocysteine methyltransferase
MITPNFAPFCTTVPGYPRVASGRVYKTLLEKFWAGKISAQEFEEGSAALRRERLETQAALGLDLIPAGDFSLYDHVLDNALQFGCVPSRFGWSGGKIDPSLYFAIARGRDGIQPLEMTKWFDTNYHYLVPELPEKFSLAESLSVEAYRFAKSVVGDKAKPVVLGPFSFLKLARLSGQELSRRIAELVPLYEQVLRDLVGEGAALIQIDEPWLAMDVSAEEKTVFESAYQKLCACAPLCIQTYYGDVADCYSMLCDLPAAAIGLDFVRDRGRNLAAVRAGFPKDKILAAGIVDGRNVWRTDLDQAVLLARELADAASPERLILSASCTLLHLPETTASETKLPKTFRDALSFARERIEELNLLSRALRNGTESVSGEWNAMRQAIEAWKNESSRFDPKVQERVRTLREEDARRMPYSERKSRQDERLGLPILPTTTIGSFPQTAELRKARAHKNDDPEKYEQAILNEIEHVIRLQEQIGLDVLVHGEPERNDMVQFFGDQMKGFATTEQGWVQSYGSRCVRPPIIFGDVDRLAAMTVKELKYAQSLTKKPVKGMLTGPITILQWSFVREDIPRSEVSYQIALAIRDEVRDLEAAGLGIVQIDEAAFREGLPLKRADWNEYIRWTIRSFKIATGGAKPETQIHTHMCYSEFGDIIEAIADMDADVISIEDSRSNGALLETLKQFRYPNQIGPGVYDIHSPNVPTVEFVEGRLRSTLRCLPADQVWVNPDCGLKTRRYEEVIPSLKNIVAAVQKVRASLN